MPMSSRPSAICANAGPLKKLMRQSRSTVITLSVVLSKIIAIRAAASSAFSFASDNSCSRRSSASAMVLNASATRDFEFVPNIDAP
jgi:hypothetical protein